MTNTAQKEAMDRAGELPHEERRLAERRALASHPAAPVQPVAAELRANADDYINADFFRVLKKSHECNSLAGDVELCEYVSKMMTDFATRAAPPVQQTGNVRDLHAEIMNLPCNPKTADLSSITDAALRAYQVGHRDARHAAAELVASVEHDALATTRPSAALTPLDLMNAAFKHCSGIVKGDHFTFSPAQMDEFARAILAASGGAHAVPEDIARDAARYRWLRDPDTDVALVIDKRTGFVPEDESVPGVGGYHTYEYRAGGELDAAIDAAMIAAAPTQDQGEGK